VSIIGVRVSLKINAGGLQPMDFARPESLVVITQTQHPGHVGHNLVLPVQPGQLAHALRRCLVASCQAGTASTGQDACRSTRSVVLPRKASSTPW